MKNFSTLLRLIRFWPPFFGAGIKVLSFNADYTHIVVQMKLRFWNKNYVGTHFGGSLYTMTDPFYMLILMIHLGKEYIVWDKSAHIRYKKPAKGTVYAEFLVSEDQINKIKQDLISCSKIESEFTVLIKDESGDVVSEVKKIIHINKKVPISNTV